MLCYRVAHTWLSLLKILNNLLGFYEMLINSLLFENIVLEVMF